MQFVQKNISEKNFWEQKYKILSKRLDYKQKRFGLLAWKTYHFGAFDDKFPAFVKKFCWFVRAEFHPLKVLLFCYERISIFWAVKFSWWIMQFRRKVR